MTMQMIVGTSETTAIANVGSSFSPALVADWLDYNKDKSPATIKTYNAALKNVFNWLADNQIVVDDLFERIDIKQGASDDSNVQIISKKLKLGDEVIIGSTTGKARAKGMANGKRRGGPPGMF